MSRSKPNKGVRRNKQKTIRFKFKRVSNTDSTLEQKHRKGEKMSNLENPRKWRFTWEAQSHSPNLRLFLFDSQKRPSLQFKNLKVRLNLSQSQLLVSWLKEEGDEEVSVRVPIPRVLIDSESPVNYRALDDHIEVKLVLLLPVHHPIVSSFYSVLNPSENGDDLVGLDAEKPLVMDTG